MFLQSTEIRRRQPAFLGFLGAETANADFGLRGLGPKRDSWKPGLCHRLRPRPEAIKSAVLRDRCKQRVYVTIQGPNTCAPSYAKAITQMRD